MWEQRGWAGGGERERSGSPPVGAAGLMLLAASIRQGHLVGDAGLFEEVVVDEAADDAAVPVHRHAHKLAEARGVVVARRPRVAKRLRDRSGLDDDALDTGQSAAVAVPASATGYAAAGQVRHDVLGGLGLAGAALAADDDGLVLAFPHQRLSRALGDGKDVRLALGDVGALVRCEQFIRVKRRKALERVH